MKLHLIMPMGGGGTRFGNQGFEVPKPLIELHGKPFFYWATQSIAKFVELDGITFVVLQDHIDRFAIDKKVKSFYPNANIVVIPEVLPGAVLTCLQGVKKLSNQQPILFNDCDHLFRSEAFYDFCSDRKFEKCDGGLLTFKASEPCYSYVAYNDNWEVSHTVEKQVVSEDAICGAYYFKSREVFEAAALSYLKNCQYSEFFVSGVYNELTKAGKSICVFQTDQHISFGTPQEYAAAKESDAYFQVQ